MLLIGRGNRRRRVLLAREWPFVSVRWYVRTPIYGPERYVPLELASPNEPRENTVTMTLPPLPEGAVGYRLYQAIGRPLIGHEWIEEEPECDCLEYGYEVEFVGEE